MIHKRRVTALIVAVGVVVVLGGGLMASNMGREMSVQEGG